MKYSPQEKERRLAMVMGYMHLGYSQSKAAYFARISPGTACKWLKVMSNGFYNPSLGRVAEPLPISKKPSK